MSYYKINDLVRINRSSDLPAGWGKIIATSGLIDYWYYLETVIMHKKVNLFVGYYEITPCTALTMEEFLEGLEHEIF